MSKLRVKEGTEECCQALDAIHDMLMSTLDQATALQSEVLSMTWSGQNRDHFVVLLDLILQYHSQLSDAGGMLLQSFINIHENILDYHTIGKVRELEGIN